MIEAANDTAESEKKIVGGVYTLLLQVKERVEIVELCN